MRKKPVVCLGAALIDESYSCREQPRTGTSNIAGYYRSPGGVARNIAHHLALLGNHVELITHFGTDPGGNWLMEQCRASGMGISNALVNDTETGRFVAMLTPGGDLFAGAVSTHFETLITPEILAQKATLFRSASLLLTDTNLSTACLNWILRFCRDENIPCIIEPVSVPKAARLLHADLLNVLLITPNRDEMLAITGNRNEASTRELSGELLKKGVQFLWIRDGKNGSGIYSANTGFELAAPNVDITDTTGAGDAALAGWIDAWLKHRSIEDCVRYGHAMASLILSVKGAIYPELNADLLETTFINLTKRNEII